MDLALTINGWIDEEVIFAQQLGARYVFAQVDCSQSNAQGWDAQSLARLRNRIEKGGLVLAGLHAGGAPAGKGRQEETFGWAASLVQEAGAAGIGLISLSAGLFPTRRSTANPVTEGLALLAEAAARAGVKLAIPAVILLKGLPGGRPVNLEKLLRDLPPSAGLDGSPDLLMDWLQDTTPGTYPPRQLIGERLTLVSFENKRRAARKLNGAGFDELLRACLRLREAGYPGLIRLGQPSHWTGDTREDFHARAFTTGYLRAVLQAFQHAGRLG